MDSLSILDTAVFDLSKTQGHRQMTDIYLAGLAHRRGGKLATFDASIPVSAIVSAPADIIEIIPIS